MDILLWLQDLRNGLLDAFFGLMTFLGSEEAMLVLLAVVYWCVNRTLGLRLAMVFLASQFLNSVLKNLFPVDRPGPPVVPAQLDTVGDVNAWPSGHAQNTAAVGTAWILLAGSRRVAVIVVVAALVFLVGLSRLYFGLHWPVDVVSGWVIGAGVGLAGYALVRAFPGLDARRVPFPWLAAGLLAPILVLVLSPNDNNAKTAGAMIGLALGWWLERRRVGFEAAAPLWQQVAKAVVGVGVAFGLRVVLKPALGVIPLPYLPDVLRYAIIALWIAWLAPLVFVRVFAGVQSQQPTSPPRTT